MYNYAVHLKYQVVNIHYSEKFQNNNLISVTAFHAAPNKHIQMRVFGIVMQCS